MCFQLKGRREGQDQAACPHCPSPNHHHHAPRHDERGQRLALHRLVVPFQQAARIHVVVRRVRQAKKASTTVHDMCGYMYTRVCVCACLPIRVCVSVNGCVSYHEGRGLFALVDAKGRDVVQQPLPLRHVAVKELPGLLHPVKSMYSSMG